MSSEKIEEGDEVFLADGEIAFASVMHAPSAEAKNEFTIYVEDKGEFLVPIKAVKAVHSGKVILDRGKLDFELLQAIRHAHDEEHFDS